jgi:two-component system, NtrC family, response regulator PilR
VEAGKPRQVFGPEAMRALLSHQWPGNVRELANAVERAVTLSDGPVIGLEALPPTVRGAPPVGAGAPPQLPAAGFDLQAHLDAVERQLLEQALARTGGVKTEAARLTGLTFRSLRYRLAKFGIGGE